MGMDGYIYSLGYDFVSILTYIKIQKQIIPTISEHEKRIEELENALLIAQAQLSAMQTQMAQ